MAAWHSAAERGDLEALEKLIRSLEKDKSDAFARLFLDQDPVNDKDDLDDVTPVYLAILARSPAAVKALLAAGADPNMKCNGSSLLHAALYLGNFPAWHTVCLELLVLLLEYNADLTAKDDRGETALHIAAGAGLVDATEAILKRAPQILEVKNRSMLRPLHTAAACGHIEIVSRLLAQSAEVNAASALGDTPLHLASGGKHWDIVRLLVENGANSTTENKRGLTALAAAWKRGVAFPDDVATLLGAEPATAPAVASTKLASKTLLVTHPVCMDHHTCTPIKRGGALPPPENVIRLKVLCDKHIGALRSRKFAAGTEWCEEAPRAAIGDVLRVHDYTYLKGVEAACESVAGEGAVKNLDDDTTVSRSSFEAAMRAAGGVCHAIDRVCGGANRNAFCVVRPPGHHAGYRGVVEFGEEKHGSAGFCLINNVAVGAAYARAVWRKAIGAACGGIERVAIIDFDVHHGNGTEDVIRNLVPTQEEHGVASLPFCTASFKTDKYRPWLNEEDADNVFFVSTHGFGRKATEGSSTAPQPWFYPGSGPSCDCGNVRPPGGEEGGAFSSSSAAKPLVGFALVGGAFSAAAVPDEVPGEPKVMNIGLGLLGKDAVPGQARLQWRDAYRRTILPRIAKFNPDLILISAGFDAHREDEMAHGFIGLLEDDYAWVTRQVVALANKCCGGRVVSMLEGGYNIRGGPISTFARSVAAHVEALQDGCSDGTLWDENDAIWESEHENHLSRERQKRRLMKVQKEREAAKAAMEARLAAIAAEDAKQASAAGGTSVAATAAAAATVAAATTATTADGSEEPMSMDSLFGADTPPPAEARTSDQRGVEPSPAKRSRRSRGGPVDYVALAAKIDAEQKTT